MSTPVTTAETSNSTPEPESSVSPLGTGPSPTSGGAGGAASDGADGGGTQPQDQAEPSRVAAATGRATQPRDKATAANQRAARQLPDPSSVYTGWWIFAIVLVVAAAVLISLVASGSAFSHAHRLSAALTALLTVIALTTLVHVILLYYQSRTIDGPAGDLDQATWDYRRRGLKAAVIGDDGRASTSKTGVVLWTAAVVWALIDLLLLARSYPGGNLFTGAVTSNWRPEYLVLLGLPIAAATVAKAAVNNSNSGQGPMASPHATAASGPDGDRVYVRDRVPAGMKGFGAGIAELITADDGIVAWADLQYVVFTLITFSYFLVQILVQPGSGLPPVPAALLTLMGVSAAGYTAKKIVDTQGTVPAQGS